MTHEQYDYEMFDFRVFYQDESALLYKADGSEFILGKDWGQDKNFGRRFFVK